eukprot:5338100-Pyramimonas_sp.AAC.1
MGHVSQGFSPDNVAILEAIADVVKVSGLQYIIAGDFNLTQDQLEHSEFCTYIKGQLFAPVCSMGTCTASCSVIDMFIVEQQLANAVRAID